jgi:rubrerythrin
MDFNNLTEIIDFAIAKEIEAAEFYRSVCEQENFSGKKEMFLEFAVEDYKFKWIADIKRSDYVEDVIYTPGMAYNDMLLLAAKREEKALALYNQMLANAATEEAKKVFKMLCQEEAKHKLALETMLDDYMAKMGD